MSAEPRITIVIPTYKRLKYLEESIRSALAQTVTELEVIISDNAAMPEVRALVEAFCDPRLRYRSNATNVGAMGNAVAAYREARAPCVGTMHDDDTWRPDAAERLLAPLEADVELVVAFADYWHVTADGRVDEATSRLNSERFGLAKLEAGVHRPFLRQALVDESVPLAISAVFRKDAVDWSAVRLEADPLTDRWLNYLLARTGRGAFFVPDRLTHYRVHGTAISTSTRSQQAVIFCLGAWLADPSLASLHSDLQRKLAEAHTLLGLDLLRLGDPVAARTALIDALAAGGTTRARLALALAHIPARLVKPSLRTWTSRRQRQLDHLQLSRPSA